MKKIRVLVVDDSSTMRGLIASALSRDPQIEVVGQAEDPL
jgi:two-component system chemotaxis response regulator CheB